MQEAFPDLFKGVNLQENIVLEGHVADLLSDEVIMFADGPKQSDKDDTLAGSIAFLCSSGGHTKPANEENTVLAVPVLCGWEKEPFLECIKHYTKKERVQSIWNEQIGLDSVISDAEATSDGAGEQIGLDDADAANDGGGGQAGMYSADDKADAVAELIYY